MNGKKIILNIGTHGDEKVGQFVANEINKNKILNGKLSTIIANPRAFKKNVRFIDQDLNRSFPGNKRGNYEQRRANELLPIIKSADILFDIHSTTSNLKDAIIVTKLNKETKSYINIINPKYVLIMGATKKTALISSAKVGIAFEYGKDKDKKVISKTTNDIKLVLHSLNMIDFKIKIGRKIDTRYFNVYNSVKKVEGAKLNKSIKNYKLIKKGEVYAYVNKTDIKAKEDFYPILFGEKNYKDIFGFAAKILN